MESMFYPSLIRSFADLEQKCISIHLYKETEYVYELLHGLQNLYTY